MRVLIINDTHLTHHFNKSKYDYIAKLVNQADQVILNGDFWDAYLTDFDSFCNSQWQKLFPLLKRKKTIYIFGNHDKREFVDERVMQFSQQQVDNYSFKSAKGTFNVQHGHFFAPGHDSVWPFRDPRFIRALYRSFTATLEYFPRFERFFYYFYQSQVDKLELKILRSYAKKHAAPNIYFIFGHSHLLFQDKKIGFISCGLTRRAKYSYCLIENGEITIGRKNGHAIFQE